MALNLWPAPPITRMEDFMTDYRKRKEADESRPTEISMDESFPEPGDIVIKAQRDDPNNYTPGNSEKSKPSGNAA
jgi:hypothetical protein